MGAVERTLSADAGAVATDSHDSADRTDSATYIGIDVGGTEIKWSLVHDAEVVRTGSAATPPRGGAALIDEIVSLAVSIDPDATGIGLAMPGLMDTVRRRTIFIPNIPGDWDGFPIAEEIEHRCGVPVAVLNDARAFANGELRAGAGRSQARTLFITLGTGVGGAIAINDGILVGPVDSVGEMGHYLVDVGGERCGCGGRGCLETKASASAIVGHVTRAALTGESPVLQQMSVRNGGTLTARLVSEAADAGDPWAIAAFASAGRYIGVAAASVCMLLQLPTVVIGGGLAGAFHHIAPSVQDILAQRVSLTGPITVRKAELGPGAGAIGAAMYAADGFATGPTTLPNFDTTDRGAR